MQVVYKSNTGYTEKYAQLLAASLNTDAMPLEIAIKN